MRGYWLGGAFTVSGNNTQCMRTDLEPINRGSNINNVFLWTGFKNSSNALSYTSTTSVLHTVLRPYNYNGVRVGDGNTPVDIRDYKLDNDRTSSFTNTTLTQNIQSVNGHLQLIVTWSGTNSSNESITIREIGLLKSVYLVTSEWYNYSSIITSPNPFTAMTVRHILDEPVEIASGDSGSVTLTIDLF